MTAFPARAAVLLLALAGLGGCATLAPQPRGDDITPLLEARGGPALDWSAHGPADGDDPSIAAWLDRPMSREAAQRVAMLRSPRLQAEYARLGLARAEVLEAVQVGNPRLSLSRLSVDGGGHQRSVGLSLPLLDLLVLPLRARLAAADYDRARYDIAAAVLGVASEVDSAWYDYVTARQVADMRAAVADGAAASAELAQRFHEAGNISELQLRQEQAAASEARIAALQARAEEGRRRLALVTLLGLRGSEAQWRAADTLPLPVPREDDPEQLVRLAREGNLELLAARQEARVMADALGITRSLRWLGGSEIGYEREREADGQRLRGPELSLELPVFNQGQARLARAEALLAGARARVAQAELSAEHGVRTAAEAVAAHREIVALHRKALVPQREAIVARQQERQNFMLVGVFELIQAKLAEYDAYQAYLESVRDYWLARVELAHAVGQALPSDADIGARTPSVPAILAPPPSAMDHGAMDHGAMDHGAMDHGAMDHGAMDHGAMDHGAMDHGAMDHGAMDHDAPAPAKEDDPAEQDEPEPADPHAHHHHGATP